MTDYIIGISAFYHDSAAAIISGEGKIIAAAQEERFTRVKHDAEFPSNAVRYILEETGISPEQVDTVAFYDKPFLKFERLLETYHSFSPKGLVSFIKVMPVWIKDKLFMRRVISKELEELGFNSKYNMVFPEHHLSHAASAFFPSPFNEAAIMTIDGVGEWASTTICHGIGNSITKLRQLDFPHSIGLLYSAFTYFCGFRVNSGEYKLMGLAPYGKRGSAFSKRCKQLILDQLIDIREDGSLLLNMDYFNFASGLTMCVDEKWESLIGIKRRLPESEFTSEYMDVACAIQEITEEIVVSLAKTAKKITGAHNLVLAGGVALNCVANGLLARQNVFDRIWIQPAAGDAGGALGAALSVSHVGKNRQRSVDKTDSMQGAYLGPQFNPVDVKRMARRFQAPYKKYSDFGLLCDDAAALIDLGKIIGWFQGRMEFGPRALGNRSIIADPRNPDMQKRLNLKIKNREGFRPFAPSVLEEDAYKFFNIEGMASPYMLMVVPVVEEQRNDLPENYHSLEMYDKLYVHRSSIPAVTHVDFSARIQTVNKNKNEKYWQLISAFKKRTGCSLIVNTSFNVRGEPIVLSPMDAYTCFMRTEMDYLVIGDYLFSKKEQPDFIESDDWKTEFVLD